MKIQEAAQRYYEIKWQEDIERTYSKYCAIDYANGLREGLRIAMTMIQKQDAMSECDCSTCDLIYTGLTDILESRADLPENEEKKS